MKGSKEKGGAHLLPDTPPARLPEETLLTRLRRDKRYRRSASLLHALLYRPRRLLTPRIPSRVAPSALRRELGYRLVAIATSLALLIGMVSLAPLNPFSLRGKARAAGSGGDDYSWLLSTSYDGSTADKAYQISNEDQLTALAKLVERLTTPTSTMSFTHSGNNYVVGPGEITNLPSSFFLIESPDLKDDAERTGESATPVPEPEPEESPSSAPEESEPPLPVETISPAPSE
ncbi:MAG TPA: hypothetical protein VN421_00260, partial [Pseudoflavonifractor sp.]|nr:hypothetical protein [Pseudoflavonifractor sp.]